MPILPSLSRLISWSIFLVLFCFITLVSFQSMDQTREDLKKIEFLLNQKIVSSELELQHATKNIMDEIDFQDLLSKGWVNTLDKSLLSKLEIGVVDRFSIFDANCQKILSVFLVNKMKENCDIKKPGIYLQYYDDMFPVIKTVHNISIKNDVYYLFSYVNLNETWLSFHNELKSYFKKFSISILNDSKKSNSVELFTVNKSSPIYTYSIWGHYYKSLFLIQGSLTKNFTMPFLILIFLLLSLCWLKNSRNELIRKDWIKNFEAFWDKISTMPLLSLPILFKSNLFRPQGVQKENKIVMGALLPNLMNLEDIFKQNERLIEKQKNLIEKIYRQSDCLKETAYFKPLVQILKLKYPNLIDRVSSQNQELSIIYEKMQNQIPKHMFNLNEVATKWQIGITQRGARKFLRSLDETEHGESSTLLMEHLNIFFQETKALIVLQKEIRSNFQRVLKMNDYFLNTVTNWYSLAFYPIDKKLNNFREVIQIASEMLRIELPNKNFTIMEFPQDIPLKELPEGILVASLYHVLLALDAGCHVDEYFLKIAWGNGALHISSKEKIFFHSNYQTEFQMNIARHILNNYFSTIHLLVVGEKFDLIEIKFENSVFQPSDCSITCSA